MQALKDLMVALLKRSPILAGLTALGMWTSGLGDGSLLGVFGATLLTLACFITGAILVARPIAEFVASPMDQLYNPPGEVIPPPLHYLIEKYEKEGRIAEAMNEYAKVLRHHPQEYPAHERRLRLAVHALRDLPMARRFYQESLHTLTHDQAREDLRTVWREMGFRQE